MPRPPGSADPSPAKTDPEARRRFLHHLNQTIQIVCGDALWRVSPVAGAWSAFTVPNDAVPFKTSGGQRLYLRSTIKFECCDRPGHPGERKVSTLFYAHTVTEDARLERELFSWQWDPSGWPYPHVHVYKGRSEGRELGGLHLPTGRVFLEQIVAFLIHDLGAVPQRGDWAEVIDTNLRRVSHFATWGSLGSLD